jgi:hypothetical protein
MRHLLLGSLVRLRQQIFVLLARHKDTLSVAAKQDVQIVEGDEYFARHGWLRGDGRCNRQRHNNRGEPGR